MHVDFTEIALIVLIAICAFTTKSLTPLWLLVFLLFQRLFDKVIK